MELMPPKDIYIKIKEKNKQQLTKNKKQYSVKKKRKNNNNNVKKTEIQSPVLFSCCFTQAKAPLQIP